MNKRSIVTVDPPWSYKTWSGKNQTRNADQHYGCMSNQELLDLKPLIGAAFPGDSIMFMWATASQMDFCIKLLEHWEYKYKTIAFTWVKLNKSYTKTLRDSFDTDRNLPMDDSEVIDVMSKASFKSLGHWSRSNAEFVLVGKKGGSPIQRVRRDIPQLVYAPVSEHSAKPDEVNRRIELLLRRPGNLDEMFELFARRQYSNWHCTGNELDGLDIRDSLKLIATGVYKYPIVEGAQVAI